MENLSNTKPFALKKVLFSGSGILDADGRYFLVNDIRNTVACYYKYTEITIRY